MKIVFGFFVGTIIITSAYLLIKQPKQNNVQTAATPTPTAFLIENAPSKSLKGTLIIIDGDVLWQNRIASESSRLTQNTTIQQGEHIETSSEGKANIIFEDVADIAIKENSSLDVVQTLPVNLVFSMTTGTVIFNKLGTNTVSVRSKHLLIQVDGKLEIQTNKEDMNIKISVETGHATLAYNNLNYETQSLVVQEGKVVIFNDSTRLVAEE